VEHGVREKWLSKNTVSVNPQRTVIVRESVPNRLSTRVYARSAMKRDGPQKQIPMEKRRSREREVKPSGQGHKREEAPPG
jgi:hypothetical protein